MKGEGIGCSIQYDMRTPIVIGLALLLAACAPAVPLANVPNVPHTTGSSASSAGPIYPLSDALARITKKPFGIFITPATSPVQPERFKGYHTGTDFETFPDEQESDVQISAICDGKVRFTGWVKGYGGVLIQDCTYENEPVTVLYGHLNIDSVSLRSGAELATGAVIGNLGKGFSTQTDGERKHLHLSIHRGTTIEYRGYVQKEEELQNWINAFIRVP